METKTSTADRVKQTRDEARRVAQEFRTVFAGIRSLSDKDFKALNASIMRSR